MELFSGGVAGEWGEEVFFCALKAAFSARIRKPSESQQTRPSIDLPCRKEGADTGNFGAVRCLFCGTHLIIHGVHPIRAQCIDGLVDQIRPPTVEHPEAQILLEFLSSSFSIQPPEGTETAFRSVKDKRTPGWCPCHKIHIYGSLVFSGQKIPIFFFLSMK